MKQTLIYTVFSLLILSGCQNDDFTQPEDAVCQGDVLELAISTSESVSPEGVPTRSADNGAYTQFESGDKVGLIILDRTNNILANNLPYKYNGTCWQYDTGNGEGKSQSYYDPSMTTYIVYYPYDPSADDVKSVEELKEKETFECQADQSTEEAYRKSDLMVWSSTGVSMKRIAAELTHIRSSFSLSLTAKCQLANGREVSFAPPAPEDFIIYDNSRNELSPYRAEDGSYRYVLPSGYKGEIRWSYVYKNNVFGGSMENVSGVKSNIRYAHEETMDLGEYTLDMVQVGDFYCTYEKNGMKYGYVLPQDAVSVLSDHQCIGVVFRVGKDNSDESEYYKPLTDNGPILSGNVHGYVVALTDVHNDDRDDCLEWEFGPEGEYDQKVGTSPSRTDWNGYSNCLKIHEFVTDKSTYGWEMIHFPAALACETYGNRTHDKEGNLANGKYDWQKPFAAPSNTSGWFLPSCGQLQHLYNNRDFLSAQISKVKDNMTNSGSKGYVKWFSTIWYYWSSSEYEYDSSYAWGVYFYSGRVDYGSKDYTRGVRAVLAF